MAAPLYVNGSGYPVIYVTDTGWGNIYPLPYCNKLTEIWEERRIRHELISPNIDNPLIERVKRKLGWHVTIILDYSTLADKETITDLAAILNTSNSAVIVLQPRHDCIWRAWEVNYISESATMDIAKGGEAAAGNKGLILQFETKHLQPSFLVADSQADLFTTHLNNHGIFSINTTI